jgi:methylated-DNA-[protein]-cysteine S-methyltransferase
MFGVCAVGACNHIIADGGVVIELLVDRIESPMGIVHVVSDGTSLCAVDFHGCEPRLREGLEKRYGTARWRDVDDPQGFSSQLRAYLAGELTAVHAIPVSTGGTPFQRQVWAALRTIPPGTTLSYGALAGRLGMPTGSRAVGAANGRNPVAIVIPCHRVVGANASLTGYAGGLERKQWLLTHEGVTLL